MPDQLVPHTPAPWTLRADGEANQYAVIGPNGRWLISFLHNGEQLSAQQLANVRLIATAPKLLRVLKVITDRDASSEAFLAALTEGRQIIAEAEGRTDG